jgi:hypothetical protein
MGAAVANEHSAIVAEFQREIGDYTVNKTLWSGLPNGLNLIADAIILAISMCPELYGTIEFNHDAFLAAWTVRRPWRQIPANATWVVRHREEIQHVQRFSISQYLWFVGRFKAQMGIDRVRKRKLTITETAPRDVWECATLLGKVFGKD